MAGLITNKDLILAFVRHCHYQQALVLQMISGLKPWLGEHRQKSCGKNISFVGVVAQELRCTTPRLGRVMTLLDTQNPPHREVVDSLAVNSRIM